MKTLSALVLLLSANFFTNAVYAQIQVNIPAQKDNTLYESATGALSNGSGSYLFVAQNNHGEVRRTLLAFDLSNIPGGASIQSARLTLNMSRTLTPAQTVTLHRVLANWGEGASDAGGEEGAGIGAATGDATWIHTFFNAQRWANAGGDFSPIPSATQSVVGIGSYSWGSTPEMVADVQAWRSTPTSNFGWLLLSNENNNGSAKRFDSRQNPIASNRPVLTVTYTTTAGIGEAGAPPAQFALAQNYPNPFNPSTIIGFQLPVSSDVRLWIYDTRGQLLRQLAQGKFARGQHQMVWDGTDEAGIGVSSGIYFYRLETEGFTATRKLMLLR